MNTSSWLIGILPLLAFALVDTFLGLKSALIAALVLAVAEVAWSWHYFGELDQISILSLLLIAIFGYLSWKKGHPLLFKLQPSLISLILGLWLLISWLNNDPLFNAMAHKYAKLLPQQVQDSLSNPHYLELLERITLTTGTGLLIHAAVSAWAAWKLSTWWWLAIRGIGFYVFCFIAMIMAQISLS